MHLIDRLHEPLLSGRRIQEPAGAVLVVIIIAIALFAALGAAIYTIATSGSYGNLAGNLSMRAFYSAESGYRYVTAKSGNLKQIEDLFAGPDFTPDTNPGTLPNGLGWFSVTAHPYFFITDAEIGQGDSHLPVRIPSRIPSGFSVPTTIRLESISKLGKKIVCDATLTALSPPQNVDFQVSPGIDAAIRKDTVVCPVAKSESGSPQHLTPGADLDLEDDTSDFFPDVNGRIKIGDSPIVYSYTTKRENPSTGYMSLTNIQGVGSASRAKLLAGFDVDDGSDVTLKPFLEIAVTGYTVNPSDLGEDESPYVGKKVITYLVPVKVPEPLLSESFNEPIATLDNWAAPSGDLADHVQTNQTNPTNWEDHEGGARLGGFGHDPNPVSDPDTPDKFIQSIFMLLDMTDELEDAWSRNNNYLSYDVQVKHIWYGIGMRHAADGICVRWSSTGIPVRYEGLGISFMCYSGIGPEFDDSIPDTIKPPGLAGTPLLVLWEQHVTAGIESRSWIAYKNLGPDHYIWTAGAFGEMSSLFVRVTEGRDSDGVKINTLKVYYGDATNPADNPDRLDIVGNDIPDDRNRWIYPPSWTTDSPGFLWPDDTVDDWREENDYMTWIAWDAVNPGASNYELSPDNMSIVTSNFVTPDDDFQDRNEISLHAFGDLGNKILFDDFAVRTVQNGFGAVSQQ